jgi:hypothetical protein
LPLLEFSVDRLPHTSANSVPFRGTIGPISDQSRTNLGQLHLARTHVATIKPPPADLPPACPRMLTVRPTPLPPIHCTSWIMRTLYLFSSGVLLWGSAVLQRVWGHCHAGSPPRPRRCDLGDLRVWGHCHGAAHLDLGDATSEKRPRRSDLGDATSCAPPLLRGTRPVSCSHMQTMPPPKTCAPPEDLCPARARRHRDLDPISDAISRTRYNLVSQLLIAQPEVDGLTCLIRACG